MAEVVERFQECIGAYDLAVPFTRTGQYASHRQTIDLRRRLGSVVAAVNDDAFVRSLYATLRFWGIGRRRSQLVPYVDFVQRVRSYAEATSSLETLQLEDISPDELAQAIQQIDSLVTEIGVVTNKSKIVAGTKTLHHLLPDLVPPMDRAWTGLFFNWSPIDPQLRQTAILSDAMEGFHAVAQVVRPGDFVGDGWRTCSSKILDNALIGYCKLYS
jgi:hypothetical protein